MPSTESFGQDIALAVWQFVYDDLLPAAPKSIQPLPEQFREYMRPYVDKRFEAFKGDLRDDLVRSNIVSWAWDYFSGSVVREEAKTIVAEIKTLGAHPVFRRLLPWWIEQGKSVSEVRADIFYVWQLIVGTRRGGTRIKQSEVAVCVKIGDTTGIGIAENLPEAETDPMTSFTEDIGQKSCLDGYERQLRDKADSLMKPSFVQWLKPELERIANVSATPRRALDPDPAANGVPVTSDDKEQKRIAVMKKVNDPKNNPFLRLDEAAAVLELDSTRAVQRRIIDKNDPLERGPNDGTVTTNSMRKALKIQS